MSQIPTLVQISSGGVAYRQEQDQVWVALISVGRDELRWQLPKGRVDGDETPEETALREVREEAGIDTELVEPIEKIDYWFYAGRAEDRKRIHKYVYFFLLRFLSGDVGQHDFEVHEARWVEIEQAIQMLAFENEKKVVRQAQQMIQQSSSNGRL